MAIDDQPNPLEHTVKALLNTQLNDLPLPADPKMRSEQVTDQIIMQNPFVFAMHQAKIQALQKQPAAGAASTGPLRLPTAFSLFNRRTEYPFDSVPNAMKLDPDLREKWQPISGVAS